MNILMHTMTLTVGENKFEPRIWVELTKEKMQSLGVQVGDRFNRVLTDGKIHFGFINGGKYKLCKKGDGAVADTNGKFLTKNGFKKGDVVTVQFFRLFESNRVNYFTISKVNNLA